MSVVTTAITDQSAQNVKVTWRPTASDAAPPLSYLTCSVAVIVGWNVQT